MRKLALFLLLIVSVSHIAATAQQSCPTPTGTLLKTLSYSPVAADTGRNIVMNCAAACVVQLPNPVPTATWLIWVSSLPGSVGTVAVSPNGLQIDGSTAVVSLGTGTGVMITTDGANYFTSRGIGGGGVSSPVTAPNPFTFLTDVANVGPSVPIDVRTKGARMVNPQSYPSTTATCVGTTCTLAAAAGFQTGDGVTIAHGGAAPTFTTPTCPTLTPSIASVGTSTGYAVAAPPGLAIYSYEVIAFDALGAYSTFCTVGTSTGAASLGVQKINIVSTSRSGQTVSIQTAGHVLATGAMIEVANVTIGGSPPGNVNVVATNTPQNDFFGAQTVGSVPDGTHLTYIASPSTNLGQASSADANSGQIAYYNENYLKFGAIPSGVWAYAVYGRSGGVYNLIGVSHPAAAAVASKELYVEDYGAPMSSSVTAPWWLPRTAPVSAGNENFTTTICAGGGTTIITLCSAPITNVTAQTIVFDDGPAIKAAYTQAQGIGNYGSISLPNPGQVPANHLGYVVNSALDLRSGASTSIGIGAQTSFNDTLLFTGRIYSLAPNGYSSNIGCGSFNLSCNMPVSLGGAPGILTDGLHTEGITFYGGDNETMIISTCGNPSDFRDSSLLTVSGTDYNSIGFYLAGGDSGGCAPIGNQFVNNLWSPGPGQAFGASGTPFIQLKNPGDVTYMERISMNRRGLFIVPNGSGMALDFNQLIENQGPVTPTITIYGNSAYSTVKIRSAVIDTPENSGYAAGLCTVAVLGVVGGEPTGYLDFEHTYSATICGEPWGRTENASIGSGVNNVYHGSQFYNVSAPSSPPQARDWYNGNIQLSPQGLITTTTLGAALAAPTCHLSTAGTLPAGNYYFQYQPQLAPSNTMGSVSQYSTACVGDGAHNIDIGIPAAVINATGYTYYVSGPLGFGGILCGPPTTALAIRMSGGPCGPINQYYPFNQGPAGAYQDNLFATRIYDTGLTPGTNVCTDPSSGAFTVSGCVSSQGPFLTALTTTAATSDNITVTGMTTSGHCVLTATNSAAATNLTTTYVSAKAANQITVTHTATAGMTYDISCTAN
jgi:hypothetical protein